MRLESARPCLREGSEVIESHLTLAFMVQPVEIFGQAVLRTLR